jgi:hypothetical protein
MFFMMMNPEKNRSFRIEYLYRPGLYWTDQEMACYHAELEAVAKDCFRQVPHYQCLSGARKELERNVITLARDHKGRPLGFCSAVILDVDGYKNVLHLGLTCVKKEARSLGLTHLLTSKLLFNYLIRTSPFRSIWVTNVACVISSIGNVALYFEKVHPSPFSKSEPGPDHICIAQAVDRKFRSPIAINEDAQLDLDTFVFRGSVGNTAFQKSRKDKQYYHRDAVLTEFYLNRLDFENGDEVLQISKVGLMSYPKYLIRLALPTLMKSLPVFSRRGRGSLYFRKM